jgi:hypothetical protein
MALKAAKAVVAAGAAPATPVTGMRKAQSRTAQALPKA